MNEDIQKREHDRVGVQQTKCRYRWSACKRQESIWDVEV